MSNELQIDAGAGEEFEPAKELVISNLETLKIAADPTRLRILEVLGEKSRTVKQVARLLETSPTKLYYHINVLEEHGLLTITSSRIVSGIIEKQYRTSAHSLRVSHELLAIGTEQVEESIQTILSAVFDTARDDVLKGIRRGVIKLEERNPQQRNSMMIRSLTRMTPEQYQEFYDRLETLLKEYNILGDTGENAPTHWPVYGLTIALYPFVELDPSEEE